MDKRYLKMVLILGSFSLLLLSKEVWAGKFTKTIRFSQTDLQLEKLHGFDKVTLLRCDVTRDIGRPQLPVKVVHFAIPPGEEFSGFKLLSAPSQGVEGKYLLYPCQPPQLLEMPGKKKEKIDFIPPDKAIYSSDEPYPPQIVEYRGIGSMGGQKIASFLVYPLQYIPAKGGLIFHPQVEIEADFTPARGYPQKEELKPGGLVRLAKKLVVNPEDVGSADLSSKGLLPPMDSYPYLIITSDSYAPKFQPLADWKTKKGLRAEIFTTSYIYDNYTGRDQQEKIRNFISYAKENWGTEWVLLGGDTEIIPTRRAYAMSANYGEPDEDSIPCDLYYADLDGSWDANGNGIYGEVADSVDMYPDVIIGRASLDQPSEVQAWVEKVLTYEKNPPTDYQLNMLFMGEVLWNNPYTDAGVGKDMIDDDWVPPRFDPITKLYQSKGNENIHSIMSAMNRGQNLINHDGHAWYNQMGYLDIGHVDGLHNGPRYSILYTIGCWPAAFDYDCVAEHFISNPSGGGVAFIGNSRYGWGSPGNPGYGYSDRFDHTFYRYLFAEDVYNIGATLFLDKASYVPRAQQANVYRWCEYEINLLGDPEMPIWTDTPRPLVVHHPQVTNYGENEVRITISDGQGALPGALVCLMNGEDVYEYGRADAKGEVIFSFSTSSSAPIELTVTAHNYLPYETSIPVQGGGTYLSYLGSAIQDSIGGNGDGELNPGESFSLVVTLKNLGSQPASGVGGLLRTDDSLVQIIDSTAQFGDIGPGDTSSSSFGLSLSTEASNNHAVPFTILLTDSQGDSICQPLNLLVVTPVLVFKGYRINGDGILEPGEEAELTITLANIGSGLAKGVQGGVSSADSCAQFPRCLIDFGDILPDSTGTGIIGVTALSGCAAPHFIQAFLDCSTQEGESFQDGFILTIGQSGFSDSMETGEDGWVHGGTNDLWHLTTQRAHSGSHSWYCGHEDSWHYDNEMDCYLETPKFVLPPKPVLSFWLWYETTTYGVDGIYVEANDGSGWRKLDFIASGGALDSALIGNSWLEDRYDLSPFYSCGAKVKIRFRFVSDGADVSEGYYVDDVWVGSDTTSSGALLFLGGYQIQDDGEEGTHGNGNGYPDPGETIGVAGMIRNFGDAMAPGTKVFLSTRDPYVTILDSIASYGSISPADSSLPTDNLLLSLPPDIPVNHIAYFSFLITDSKGDSWDNTLKMKILEPEIELETVSLDDIGGNHNGIPDPGETCNLILYLRNKGGRKASGTEVILSTQSPEVDILDNTANFPDIPVDSVRANTTDTLTIQIANSVSDPIIPFRLSVSEGGGYYTKQLSFSLAVGWGRTLLVENDGLVNNRGYYTETLDSLGVMYEVWDVDNDGPLPQEELLRFKNVIWYIGEEPSPLPLEDREHLKTFLDSGGSLLISGQWALYGLHGTDFYRDYLHAQYVSYSTGYHHLLGLDNNPVIDGLNLDLSQEGNNEQDAPGEIDPIDPAFSILVYDSTSGEDGQINSSGTGALAVDNGDYRLVFLAFGLEGVEPLHSRIEFLHGVLNWLWRATGVRDNQGHDSPLPKSFSLAQNYPNPFNPSTVIRYSLPVARQKRLAVSLKIYNILGQEVRSLVEEKQAPGYYEVKWDGKDEGGNPVSSGIYFYRLNAGGFSNAKRMVLLR